MRLLLRSPRGRLRPRRGARGGDARVHRGRAGVHLALRSAAARPGRRAGGPGRGLDAADGGRTRLAEVLGVRELWLKDDTRNPTGSFKDRVVSVALSSARRLGFTTAACASTGNLATSVAAHAAAHRLAERDDHPRGPGELQDRDDRDLRRDGAGRRGQLRRRQPALRGAGRRAPRLGLRQRQRSSLLRRRLQDPGLRDRRAARLALARPGGRAGRLGQPVHQGRQGLPASSSCSGSSSGDLPGALRRPGAGLLADRHGLRRRRRRRHPPTPEHDRALAGHRQPGRRPLRARRTAPRRRRLRGGRTTRRSSSASRCWREPRASSPRPPAASPSRRCARCSRAARIDRRPVDRGDHLGPRTQDPRRDRRHRDASPRRSPRRSRRPRRRCAFAALVAAS